MKTSMGLGLALSVAMGCGAMLRAQVGALLVISKRDHTVAVVDARTLKVLGRVPVGNDPHEVIASADGTMAWVSNYGSGAYNTLAAIDLRTIKALPAVDLGALRGPHGLTFVGGETWFTAEAAKAIGRYNPATGKVDLVLGTGQNRTHMLWVSEDQQRVITSNVSSGTLSLMERVTLPAQAPPPGGAAQGGPPPGPPPTPSGDGKDWTETVVKVGNGSEGFDLTPDRKELWVGNAQDGTISVIDYAAKQVVATLTANVQGVNRLKFTPDGKLALVSMLSGPDVAVFDVATRKEIKRIPTGHGAAGIEMEPGGKRAFVACGPDDYVAVIDLATLTVSGKIDAGGQPDGMAWAVR